MKIAFHSNQLGMRGTEVALFDYAYFNREYLGNESVIVSDQRNDLSALTKFQTQFEICLYEEFSAIEKVVTDNNIDAVYYIKAGNFDGKLVKNAKNLVHAVFQVYQPHGDIYAYISQWLAQKMSSGKVPFVPHMIHLPDNQDDFREVIGISDDAIVFGRYGGEDQFDIPFVHEVVYQVARRNKNIFFLFMNTRPFCNSLENIIHLKPTYDLFQKSRFINTCDAMLHARRQGESFGLAIGEFLLKDKPVVASLSGADKGHLAMIGNTGLYYRNASELYQILLGFRKPATRGKFKTRVEMYSPQNVMEIFQKVFLN